MRKGTCEAENLRDRGTVRQITCESEEQRDRGPERKIGEREDLGDEDQGDSGLMRQRLTRQSTSEI